MAEEIARGFANARIVRVEEMAHAPEALTGAECLEELLVRFYETADGAAADASCIAAMHAPPFDVGGAP